MKINKIKINSYGKLKEKEIDLKENINIVYGENEKGKSTLLNFIVNSFYGISKNKRGKEISDFEKYTPWVGDEFSGKLEYELDNEQKYEIYRDFKKKNPKIFNDKMEEISKDFNIDKAKGNEFFYEQTKVDQDLFLSTIVVNQQEVKLEKGEQNILIQKIANLVGTGEDNVSFKRAIDRINRRQLDEIGTERSSQKPMNIISKEIEELESKKAELSQYEELKYEIEENKNNLEKEISILDNENNLLREINLLNNNEEIEKEKVKIKKDIKKNNLEKIESLKENLNKIKIDNEDIFEMTNKRRNNKKNDLERNKLNKRSILLFIVLIIINILQFVFIKNRIINYSFLLTIPVFLAFYVFSKSKLNNKIKMQEYKEKNELLNLENLKNEINKIENEINLLEENNNDLDSEIQNIDSNFNLKMNLEKEKIKNKYKNKIKQDRINELINIENINYEIENLQNVINDKKIKLHTLEFDKGNIEQKTEDLPRIEETLVSDNEKMVALKNLEKSMNLAKEVLSSAYEKMKNTVTPKFTKELSNNISNITNSKYKKVMFNEDKGLIVELDNGEYVPASRLSIGTIDQLYLSLRLSMVEDLSEEKMPIILDEAFAYYDTQRLENILKYINEKYCNHQVIIFTCTNREKEILNRLNINYSLINL